MKQVRRVSDQVCRIELSGKDALWPSDRPKGAAFFYVRDGFKSRHSDS